MDLFNNKTTAIFYNQHPKPIQQMLDFDFLCKRETPSVAAIVNPNRSGFHRAFFGTKEIMIPVFRTLEEASEKYPKADVLINFASERTAFEVTKNAIVDIKPIKTIHIMAEGIPENFTRELIRLAKKYKKFLIGPATAGAIKPGCFRTGQAGGSITNLIASKLYRPGSVGVVTISGGMLGEILNIVARDADGAYEGIAIGGDQFAGSTLLENLLRLEKDKNVKMLVCLGEIGGTAEYEIADAIKSGKIKKPVVIWVTGTIAKYLKTEVQFGHAGAKSGVEKESAQAKNEALKKAGAYVPKSFNDFGKLINKVFKSNVASKKDYIKPIDDDFNNVPLDYSEALKQNLVRKPASIVSTVSDDRGEEPTYNKKPISKYAKASLGHTINALWFKGKLTKAGEEFIELCLKITADHGPAVGTAHNSIVSSRGGNNVVMNLIAGLTTIGPRHGGAIDGAANWALYGIQNNMNGLDIINWHKKNGKLIMGIGHRIKSVQNPDERVKILLNFAKKNLKSSKFLNLALDVEAETTKKKNNLILNVDGAIGVIFLDILTDAKYSDSEIKQLVDSGALNAIFVLGRSIGIIGHSLDQKRLNEPLYRHDWEDILYL